jgi:hypothetical protein
VSDTLVKADRDQDLYLIWSSIVDAPIWIGTRAELLKQLWTDFHRKHPNCDPKPGTGPDVRLARADEFGTSDLDGDYGWEQESFILMAGAPDDDYFYDLPRTNLAAYATTLVEHGEVPARAHLRRAGRVSDVDEPH